MRFRLLSALGEGYAALGRESEAQRLAVELEALSENHYVPEHLIALVYSALNDKEKAFTWLERADEARDACLIWLRVDPGYDPLRSDPRFAQLLRKLNLPEEAIQKHLALPGG
jgi:hypothetical protein